MIFFKDTFKITRVSEKIIRNDDVWIKKNNIIF